MKISYSLDEWACRFDTWTVSLDGQNSSLISTVDVCCIVGKKRALRFKMFPLFHCINTRYIKGLYGGANARDDCTMIYSPNSCHGNERPPESFANTFNKTGWKFVRVIFWLLMKKNEILQMLWHAKDCIELEVFSMQWFGQTAHVWWVHHLTLVSTRHTMLNFLLTNHEGFSTQQPAHFYYFLSGMTSRITFNESRLKLYLNEQEEWLLMDQIRLDCISAKQIASFRSDRKDS